MLSGCCRRAVTNGLTQLVSYTKASSQGVPTGAITEKSYFFLIELRTALQEGIHIWYSKLGQESAPSEEVTSAVRLTGHDVPVCQLPST